MSQKDRKEKIKLMNSLKETSIKKAVKSHNFKIPKKVIGHVK